MLFGDLRSFNPSQCGHEGVVHALNWAREHDLAALEPGRHEIDGDNVFLNLNAYTSKPLEDCVFEAHYRYIDVHLMVEGEERIDSKDVSSCTVTIENREQDYCLLDGSENVQCTITPGTFAVYFPEDAHKPGIAVNAPSPVKKAIFKVLV